MSHPHCWLADEEAASLPPSGGKVENHFFFASDAPDKSARVLVSGEPFQPCLWARSGAHLSIKNVWYVLGAYPSK